MFGIELHEYSELYDYCSFLVEFCVFGSTLMFAGFRDDFIGGKVSLSCEGMNYCQNSWSFA